jgi:protein SDA1
MSLTMPGVPALIGRTDAKTVSIAALAAFHPNTKVQSAALHFFLGSENDEPESEDEDDGIRSARKDVRKMEHSMGVGKSGRKQEKQLRQLQKEASKVRRPDSPRAELTLTE